MLRTQHKEKYRIVKMRGKLSIQSEIIVLDIIISVILAHSENDMITVTLYNSRACFHHILNFL